MSNENSVPAAPDTGYFKNEQQAADIALEASRAREAVLGAEAAGLQRVCVAATVPQVVDSGLSRAELELWRAARALNLAGLGESALYRELDTAARKAQELRQRLAVQMYA